MVIHPDHQFPLRATISQFAANHSGHPPWTSGTTGAAQCFSLELPNAVAINIFLLLPLLLLWLRIFLPSWLMEFSIICITNIWMGQSVFLPQFYYQILYLFDGKEQKGFLLQLFGLQQSLFSAEFSKADSFWGF